ncbi:BolA family protein [Marinicellulosiphila megalodicopiae]|uniref:BolA family protein n=1 Tax=Marinicellulosiphila megalodicopiae TaxID=2724896 RepID=UPI003BB053CA
MIELLEQKIQNAINPIELLDIQNESHMHSGPAQNSHFKLVIVSDHFKGVMPVKRHQMIYEILKEELAGEIHALAIHPFTIDQWAKKQTVPVSPNCAGKNI